MANYVVRILTPEQADALFVRFRDQNGNPLPSGAVVTIVVNTTTGDIDDIIYEGP